MKILVTGCAGFIGSNLVDRLLDQQTEVLGIDNFNDYYDPQIKRRNLQRALQNPNFKIWEDDILDAKKVEAIFEKHKVDIVVHLAARAGVRPSIADPDLYARVNVEGTVNLLVAAKNNKVGHFILASSSSVYGESVNLPFSEDDLCENIVSPYGASKRSAEFFAESFYKTFGLKVTIIRFFSVYGKRGRLDMAPSIFANSIITGKRLSIFGDGTNGRDWTNVDDIVDGIVKSFKIKQDFTVINLGNNHPVTVVQLIKTLEETIGKKAIIHFEPKALGDVSRTWANIKRAKEILGWEPNVGVKAGLRSYVDWLKDDAKIF